MKKTKLGQSIIKGLNEAIGYKKGKKKLRVSKIEIPDPAPVWTKKEIADIRKKIFQVSQPVFANILCVTASTVRAWEQGRKKPSGSACRLIQIISIKPEIIRGLKAIYRQTTPSNLQEK